MFVANLKSPRTGNPVANQFVISFNGGYVFQSYRAIVAAKLNGETYITEDWEYSKTTMKYVKEFLNTTATAKVIRERIADGTYKLVTGGDIRKMVDASNEAL